VRQVLKGERGFTLVEVVVAIMVLSLVTVAVVQIYHSNLFGIIRSGHRTEAIYEVQNQLEQEVAQGPSGRDDPGPDEKLEIEFAGRDKAIEVPGWTINKESSGEGPKSSATVFVPQPKPGE
jgi:prepilin-type N-terminal cleavage/methylation domain-containing protein